MNQCVDAETPFNGRLDGGELGRANRPIDPSPHIIYPVEITRAHNGFIVRVGCKTFVSKQWSEVAIELGAYYANPSKAIAEWTKKEIIN